MYEHYRGERMAAELICQPEGPWHPAPVVVGWRAKLVAFLALCLLLGSVLVLFVQVRGFLGHVETKLAVESGGDSRLRAMSQHLGELRGRFHGLLEESVETRLKELEKTVASGKVNLDDLKAFGELQKDIEALENYAVTDGTQGFDYARREHDRFRAVPELKPVPRNDELLREAGELKNLVYFCAAGLATGTALMLGYYWVLQRRNARYLEAMSLRTPLLPPGADRGI
ncbi:hypothetical protein [Methylomagnum sp.]